MLILFVGMKWDYGRPDLGPSFERLTFLDTLQQMGNDVLAFDFKGILLQRGRDGMNTRLAEIVSSERPRLMFTVLFGDELREDIVRRISLDSETVTVNWFCDDHWRFDGFTSRWAPCFNWSVTTDGEAVSKYRRIGYVNVIKSQWACNPRIWRKLDLPLAHDLSFVGQRHGIREQLIRALQSEGFPIRTWGSGWPAGRLSADGMVEVFNTTRVNLNISAASTALPGLHEPNRFRIRLGRLTDAFPGGRRSKDAIKNLLVRAMTQVRRDASRRRVDSLVSQYPQQLKGRHFEIPGCGGFLLTDSIPELRDYYEPGVEIACYQGMAELCERLEYYLSHEGEREAIAQAGYARTVREHTYAHRLAEVFDRIGLPTPSPASVLSGSVQPGCVHELS